MIKRQPRYQSMGAATVGRRGKGNNRGLAMSAAALTANRGSHKRTKGKRGRGTGTLMRRACEPLRARWVNCMADKRGALLLVRMHACQKMALCCLYAERRRQEKEKKETVTFFLSFPSRSEGPSRPIPFCAAIQLIHTVIHSYTHMPSSCKEIRAELAECILKSNCMVVDGLSAKDCLHPDNEYRVPAECIAIRKSFFECRRGMVLVKTNQRARPSYFIH